MSRKHVSFFERRRLQKWEARRNELGYENSATEHAHSQVPLESRPPPRNFYPLTTPRALLASGILIAASIVIHAWITRPPHYQLIHQQDPWVIRMDTRTGVIIRCTTESNESSNAHSCQTIQLSPPK
ncbi:MAG: hypothetical protein ACRDHZ_09040 [Ktedonobacteraceae bacterium]